MKCNIAYSHDFAEARAYVKKKRRFTQEYCECRGLLNFRRLHVRSVDVRVAGQLKRELRTGDGSLAIRPYGLSLQKSDVREARRTILRASSLLQYATTHWIFSHSGMYYIVQDMQVVMYTQFLLAERERERTIMKIKSQ